MYRCLCERRWRACGVVELGEALVAGMLDGMQCKIPCDGQGLEASEAERVRQLAVAETLVARRGMRCFVLLLLRRRQVGVVRNLVHSRALLPKGEQDGECKTEDQATQHGRDFNRVCPEKEKGRLGDLFFVQWKAYLKFSAAKSQLASEVRKASTNLGRALR